MCTHAVFISEALLLGASRDNITFTFVLILLLRITEVVSLSLHIHTLYHASSELFCLTAFKQKSLLEVQNFW